MGKPLSNSSQENNHAGSTDNLLEAAKDLAEKKEIGIIQERQSEFGHENSRFGPLSSPKPESNFGDDDRIISTNRHD